MIRRIVILILILSLGLTIWNGCAEDTETEPCKTEAVEEYILNTDSKKIHRTTCGTGDRIKKENRQRYVGDLEALFQKGYTTCGNCFP